MSEYSKKWEQVKIIRDEIKRLVPTAETNTLKNASTSVESFKTLLDILLDQWKLLEEEMEKEEE